MADDILLNIHVIWRLWMSNGRQNSVVYVYLLDILFKQKQTNTTNLLSDYSLEFLTLTETLFLNRLNVMDVETTLRAYTYEILLKQKIIANSKSDISITSYSSIGVKWWQLKFWMRSGIVNEDIWFELWL